MSEGNESKKEQAEPSIADKLKQVMQPDSLIGRRGDSVQRTGETEAVKLHSSYDPAVYDAQRNIIGYVTKAADGGFLASLTDHAIGGTYATRDDAEEKVWQAYLKRNPKAVRPQK